MWKNKARTRMPAIPATLIWPQVIEGTTHYSLQHCVEQIEAMAANWEHLHHINVYPLAGDAEMAEFVITLEVSNKVNAWLFVALQAETPNLTRVQAEAGVDQAIKWFLPLAIVIEIALLLFFQSFLAPLLGLSIGLILSYEMRSAYQMALFNALLMLWD